MRRLTAAAASGRLVPRRRAGPSQAQLLLKRRLARVLPRHGGRLLGGIMVAVLLGTGFAGTANLLNRQTALGRVALSTTARLGLTVQSVEVEGRTMTPPAEILKAIGVERGTPILAVNPAQAKNRLEGLSWVRAAVVERRLPDTIHIALTERQPLALWQHHGQMVLIDHDGVVVTTEDLGRFADFLLVVGENAPAHTVDLMALLERQPALAKHVQSAVWVSERRWDLHFSDGITVQLPADGPAAAWDHLAALERDHGLMARRIDLIDMRFADRVVVRVTPDPAATPAASAKPTATAHHAKHTAHKA